VGDRKLARGFRAAKLVGDDRLAARRRLEREAAQVLGVAHGFEEQHVAVDAGIVERRRADVAEREIDLVADRNEAGEADAARLPARKQRADQAAAVGGGEDAADRQLGLVERGIGGEHGLLRRSTTPRLEGPTTRMPPPRMPRAAPRGRAFATGFRRSRRRARSRP
jgi:hypothetical protein